MLAPQLWRVAEYIFDDSMKFLRQNKAQRGVTRQLPFKRPTLPPQSAATAPANGRVQVLPLVCTYTVLGTDEALCGGRGFDRLMLSHQQWR